MNSAWLILITSLLSSALTFLGAWKLDSLRRKSDKEIRDSTALSTACNVLIGASLRLTQRASHVHLLMMDRSGIKETLDIILHHRRPFDIMEYSNWLMTDLGPILDAQSQIWILGNDALIRTSADVVESVGELIESASSFGPRLTQNRKPGSNWGMKQYLDKFKTLKWSDANQERLNDSIRKLGASCRAFATEMRKANVSLDAESLNNIFPKRLRNDEKQTPTEESSWRG